MDRGVNEGDNKVHQHNTTQPKQHNTKAQTKHQNCQCKATEKPNSPRRRRRNGFAVCCSSCLLSLLAPPYFSKHCRVRVKLMLWLLVQWLGARLGLKRLPVVRLLCKQQTHPPQPRLCMTFCLESVHRCYVALHNVYRMLA